MVIPNLALAAVLGSGLWGVEQEMELDDPIAGSAYDMKHPSRLALPATPMAAAEWLRKSRAG